MAPAASLNAGKAGVSLHRNVAIASFSLDASIRVEGPDRAGLERLLRYCARPPVALERLEQLGEDALIYRFDQPQPDGRTQLRLTPLQLIERMAALIPPPRLQRHRYHGLLD